MPKRIWRLKLLPPYLFVLCNYGPMTFGRKKTLWVFLASVWKDVLGVKRGKSQSFKLSEISGKLILLCMCVLGGHNPQCSGFTPGFAPAGSYGVPELEHSARPVVLSL